MRLYFNHQTGRSQKKFAQRLNCDRSYVSKMLKTKTNIRCRKRTKKPLMTENQKRQARPKCRKLVQQFGKNDFILDDESYFTLRNTALAGNDCFYSDNLEEAPEEVSNHHEAKYDKKLMVWLAISPKGMTRPIFLQSGLAVNRYFYSERCIKIVMVPFIREHYPKGGYVFWPDLASSHYAGYTINTFNENSINFVPKAINPANLPQARPIEDFSAILKQKVYENDWSAKNIRQLRQRIMYCMKKIDPNLVQRLADSTKSRLDHIRRHGI